MLPISQQYFTKLFILFWSEILQVFMLNFIVRFYTHTILTGVQLNVRTQFVVGCFIPHTILTGVQPSNTIDYHRISFYTPYNSNGCTTLNMNGHTHMSFIPHTILTGVQPSNTIDYHRISFYTPYNSNGCTTLNMNGHTHMSFIPHTILTGVQPQIGCKGFVE